MAIKTLLLILTLSLFFPSPALAQDGSRSQCFPLLFKFCPVTSQCQPFWQECSNPNPTPPPRQIQPSSYQLGAQYLEGINNLLDRERGWARISEIADVAYIQRNWNEVSSLGFNEDVRIARQRGLKLYLAFEPFSAERTSIGLPPGLSGNFGSPSVRSAYLQVVKDIASNFRPEYFIINVEANLYQRHNPSDYNSYKTLYREAFQEIKNVSPGTLVAASLVYNDYNGNGFDDSDRNTFRGFVNDFQPSDLLAVSLYPFWYVNTTNIPKTLFSSIINDSGSNQPLFISETGWISDNFNVGGIIIPNNAQNQAEYIRKLQEAADFSLSQGKNISVINYVALIDANQAACDALTKSFPNLSWYCTLALIDNNNVLKPSFNQMQSWHSGVSIPTPSPTPSPTPTPSSTCRSVDCPVAPVGCSFVGRIPTSCNPNIEPTCGNLVCLGGTPSPTPLITSTPYFSPTPNPTNISYIPPFNPLPTATITPLLNSPSPTPTSSQPGQIPNPKTVIAITINGQLVNLSNPILNLRLPGIEGQPGTYIIPVTVVYSDRTTRFLSLSFNYNPMSINPPSPTTQPSPTPTTFIPSPSPFFNTPPEVKSTPTPTPISIVNQPPSCFGFSGPDRVKFNQTANFEFQAQDPDGPINQYTWVVVNPNGAWNPIGYGQNFIWQFTNIGNFIVGGNVQDNEGLKVDCPGKIVNVTF